METKLVELTTALETARANKKAAHEALLEELREFVTTEIIEPNGAHLSRLYFRTGFRDNIEVVFETSFLTESGKEDFGSDCWFEYNDKGLNINHGTIGSWTKENKYQILRINMLHNVCLIMPELEAAFERIVKKHSGYMELESKVWKLESEIKNIERELKKQEAARKFESVHVGTILCYPETFHPSSRLFATSNWTKVDDNWKVIKISEKTVQVESLKNGATCRINKEKLQMHIMNVGLEIINDNKEN